MTDPAARIGEDDLHGYVDGQIAPSRREEVEQYLATDPEAAARVASWQWQRATLQAVFADSGAPLPERLELDRILREHRHRRARGFTDWRIAAGLVLALGAGAAGGWLLHPPATPSRATAALAVLQQEALSSHTVYAADRRHPVEVAADDQAHLIQWLSNRLGQSVAPPDLSSLGYRLIGGRLLATEHGRPAALFMYDSPGGKRLSVLLRPMAPSMVMPETDFAQGDMNGCAWIGKGMGYALVAAMPATELDRVAGHIQNGQGTG